jgi:hypothetical protein
VVSGDVELVSVSLLNLADISGRPNSELRSLLEVMMSFAERTVQEDGRSQSVVASANSRNLVHALDQLVNQTLLPNDSILQTRNVIFQLPQRKSGIVVARTRFTSSARLDITLAKGTNISLDLVDENSARVNPINAPFAWPENANSLDFNDQGNSGDTLESLCYAGIVTFGCDGSADQFIPLSVGNVSKGEFIGGLRARERGQGVYAGSLLCFSRSKPFRMTALVK